LAQRRQNLQQRRQNLQGISAPSTGSSEIEAFGGMSTATAGDGQQIIVTSGRVTPRPVRARRMPAGWADRFVAPKDFAKTLING
jgi:hypothetical protein